MKKLYSFLFATAISITAANSQVPDGSDCSHAKEIPTIPDSCAVNEHQMNAGDYEQWHHVKPTQSEMHFKIEPPQTQPVAHIHKALLIKGGCGGMQTMEEKDISLGQTLEITRTDLAPNEDYYIKIERDSNCAQCSVQGAAFYGLCVERIPAVCNEYICANGDPCGPGFNIGDCCQSACNTIAPYCICPGGCVDLTLTNNCTDTIPVWNTPGGSGTWVQGICNGVPTGETFYQVCYNNPGNYPVTFTLNGILNESGPFYICVATPAPPTPPEPIIATPNPLCWYYECPPQNNYITFNYPVCPDGFTGFCNGSGCVNPGGEGEWGSSNGGINPYTWIYFNPGTYTATLDCYSSGICPTLELTTQTTVIITEGTLSVAASPNAACAGVPINFTTTGCINPNSTYLWTFGDGTTSTALNPTHTYAQPGAYVPYITINDCISASTPVVISPQPNITMPATALICNTASATINANITGGANITYSWSPSSGVSPASGTFSGGNIAFTFSNNINTTYTLTASIGGCSGTKTILVKSSKNLIANAGPNKSFCSGGSTSITAFASGGTAPHSFLWSNGTATASNTVNAAGTYTVTVTDANGCKATASATVTVNPKPIVTITAIPTCSGQNTGTATAIAAAGVPPYSFGWSNGQTGPTATGLTAGTYTVTVTDANGCTATAQAVITVKTEGECCSEAYTYTYRSITVSKTGSITIANYIDGNGNPGSTSANTLFNGGTSTFSVRDHITINAPADINMNVRTIKFGPNGKLIIKKGARLTLLKANVLRSIECATVMWQGVFVEGNTNASQAAQNQGWLIITNSTPANTIMDAHVGARNFNGGFFTNDGGIIQATGASFINNNTGVLLFPYNGLNYPATATYFKNCLFETNAFLKDVALYGPNKSQDAFATLFGVSVNPLRILFECNTFQNLTPQNFLLKRGVGIKSIDAQYDVVKGPGKCNGGNFFNKLDIGIDDNRSLNSPIPNDVNILNNTFSDNLYGILFTGTGFGRALVQENNFTQTVFTGPFQLPSKYGIYSKGGGKINIFKNTFTKHTVGCFIDNSGTGGFTSSTQFNNAWTNTFTNCGRGLEFTKDNTRFQVLCNTFNNGLNNAQAYWVVNNGNVKNPQGNGGSPCMYAANTFGTPTPPKKDISLVRPNINFDPSFTYYYNGTAPLVDNSGCNPNPCNNMVLTQCGQQSACSTQPQKVAGDSPQQIAQQLSAATNQQERMELIHKMLESLLDDNKMDSIIPFLENVPDTEAKWLLVPEYIAKKKFTDAETVLNGLQKDNLEKQKKDEYYKVHIELGKTDRIPTDMTAIEKSTVEQVALSETEIKYNAQAMLHFWFNEKYEPELAVLGSNKMAALENGEKENVPVIIALDKNENKVSSIYPNPNDGTMRMDYELKKGQKGNLVIYDMTGRIVRQYILNTENKNLQIELMTGIYFYNVSVNGELAISNKLVIIK